MSRLLQIIERGDPCPLSAVILILVLLGGHLTSERQRRIGLVLATAAFLAFGVFSFLSSHLTNAEQLLTLAVRSLLCAGLVLGASWLILPLLASLWHLTVSVFWVVPTRWRDARRKRADERRARREGMYRLGDRAQGTAQSESEETRRKAEAQSQAEEAAQRRRDSARAACELLYLGNPDLAKAVPRAQFEQFVSRFLSDSQPPEVVEENARRLQDTMLQLAGKSAGAAKDLSIADRATYLEEQIRQIQVSTLGDREKETLVVMLKKQFMAGLQKEIEEP